mmetsp:Transcript_7434/g.22611  ORF Transcript_7434/g.22611 Transcript_7434/m.22611 type:complete len:274 (+) Transcript_7434:54-875(+)
MIHGSLAIFRLLRGTQRRQMSSLRLTEMFTSVQGEGPHCGRPSVFLRLGLCNLECIWCDTKYTWLYDEGQLKRIRASVPENMKEVVGDKFYKKKDEITKYSIPSVLDMILSAAGGDKKVSAVVITGGEPLLHKKPLLDLCPALLEKGFDIEFETNGTLSPSGLPETVHYNVSAKLSNSHQSESKRINLRVLQEFSELDSVLKFVISSDDDLREAANIAQKAGFAPERVFLMPEGTNVQAIADRGRWLVDQCLKYGYHYSHRVHVSLWGDQRGV